MRVHNPDLNKHPGFRVSRTNNILWLFRSRRNNFLRLACLLFLTVFSRKAKTFAADLLRSRVFRGNQAKFSQENKILLFILQNARAHVVTLEPGDVLYVPRHWWHYVVSIETSISVNTWFEMVRICFRLFHRHQRRIRNLVRMADPLGPTSTLNETTTCEIFKIVPSVENGVVEGRKYFQGSGRTGHWCSLDRPPGCPPLEAFSILTHSQDADDEARLHEAVTRTLMCSLLRDVPSSAWLNPTEVSSQSCLNFDTCEGILHPTNASCRSCFCRLLHRTKLPQ